MWWCDKKGNLQKNKIIVVITDTCTVRVYKDKMCRDICLSFRAGCCDSNDDNTILFIFNCDTLEINVLDLKRGKVVDSLKVNTMLKKI